MILVKIFCVAFLIYAADSAVCPGQDSCQHNYGKRLKSRFQAQATFLAFTTVTSQPSSSYDPIPCCINCNKQPGCDYYYLEFDTGNCTLFSLPDSDKFVTALLGGQLYEDIKYEGSCIGYPNNYIFNNLPPVDLDF
jgi:hypothetical protein